MITSLHTHSSQYVVVGRGKGEVCNLCVLGPVPEMDGNAPYQIHQPHYQSRWLGVPTPNGDNRPCLTAAISFCAHIGVVLTLINAYIH